MNKKLLYIGITLLIVGMILAPVSAIVTPPTTFKDIFFKGIWTAIMDLQKQITNIKTTPGPQGPAGNDGATVHFGESQDILLDSPTGEFYNNNNPAANDGFVTLICRTTTTTVYVSGFTRIGLPSPTNLYKTQVESHSPLIDGSASASITMPVRKGEYWGVQWGGCGSYRALKWLPLST